MFRATISALVFAASIATSAVGQAPAPAHVPPPDGDWVADSALVPIKKLTDLGLGAVQGVAVRDGKIYAYGDLVMSKPRVGVIREYDLELNPTGRIVWLTKGGEPLMLHPTGLTWNSKYGTFLGDTVNKKAVIYRLDWDAAWRDGKLDNAILDTITDDAAVNGCRPTLVTVGGKTLLATSDYGDVRPEIRLCDIDALLKSKRTSAPGVIVARVLCGPYNQNMYWNESTGELTLVQNVIEGRGWRLDVVNLAKALADGRVDGEGVRVKKWTFMPHDELEGYWPVDAERVLFAIARRADNVVLGKLETTKPTPSPAESK